ncbi:hypothetical protein C8R45DRAFT_1111764 [Mycena sanguinolenta]|nr:hypothetical protein C8R45DRAFT_1111764 [Mycena sanguinolenta]
MRLLRNLSNSVISTVYGLDFTLSPYPFFGLSLVTNVLVTALTAGRIWGICRRYLKISEQWRSTSCVTILTITLNFLVLEQPTSDVNSFLSPPMFIATGRVEVEDYVALLDQYFDFGANGLRVPDTEVQEYYDKYCHHISRPASATKESNTSNEITPRSFFPPSCNLPSALSPRPSKD